MLMNNTITRIAREQIKEGLEKLPVNHQRFFKRLYAIGELSEKEKIELPINDVVDNILDEKLSHALDLVEDSLKKIGGKNVS